VTSLRVIVWNGTIEALHRQGRPSDAAGPPARASVDAEQPVRPLDSLRRALAEVVEGDGGAGGEVHHDPRN
jgi:hypothetical protein